MVAMATYIFNRLIMGKVKIDNFFCLNRYIWNLFSHICLLSSPLATRDMSFVQSAELD